MASEFEYNPTPVQGVTLGTRDAAEMAEYARRDRERRQQAQQQQAAPDAGQQSGGGRQQRPVTMNQNTVGAVTSDGQVIPNPGYTPDAKRQDAFDNYARAGMRKNAEASRQQYYDTIRANESLQNDQFKKGVDEVNQRGFNLYGVMQDIDKSGGKDLSPEQGRMLEAATTDFGKQVAKNYGWQFNGAEYDWDNGTFTFQFQNDKGQIGTKTMSRDALNAQMIKAGYIDDPVEVRKREMEAQEKQRAEEQKQAQWAAELGLKTEEMNRKFAAMDDDRKVKMVEALSKFQGEDGNLTDTGKLIMQLFLGQQGGGGAGGQQGGEDGGAQKPPSAAAATFGTETGSGARTVSRREERNMSSDSAEMDEQLNSQLRDANKTNAMANTPSPGVGKSKPEQPAAEPSSAEPPAATTQSSRTGVTKFGGSSSSQPEEGAPSDEKKYGGYTVAELEAKEKRSGGNGSGLTAGQQALLAAKRGEELSQDQVKALQKAYGKEEANDIVFGREGGSLAVAEEKRRKEREALFDKSSIEQLNAKTKAGEDKMNAKYADYRKRQAERKKAAANEREAERAREIAKFEREKRERETKQADSAMESYLGRNNAKAAREVARDKTRLDSEAEQRKFNDRISRARQMANSDRSRYTDEMKSDVKEFQRVRSIYQNYIAAANNQGSLTREQSEALREWEKLRDANNPMANYILSSSRDKA